MTSKFISIFVLGLMLISGANAQTETAKEALAALKKYDDAWNAKDAKTVDGMLHANYVYFSSEGATTSRAKTLEFLSSPKYILTFVERSEMSTFDAGKTVIVSSRWKGKGSYNEQAINDDQRCSLVFVKEGKSWRLLSEHCTQIVTK